MSGELPAISVCHCCRQQLIEVEHEPSETKQCPHEEAMHKRVIVASETLFTDANPSTRATSRHKGTKLLHTGVKHIEDGDMYSDMY